jgi:hypothetical protein
MVEGVKPGGGVGGGIRTGRRPAALGQIQLGRLCEAGDGVWERQRHAGPQWMACRAVTPDGAQAEALGEGIEEEATAARLAGGPRAVAASAAATGCGRSSRPKGGGGGALGGTGVSMCERDWKA